MINYKGYPNTYKKFLKTFIMWFEVKYYLYTEDGILYDYTINPVIIPLNKNLFIKEIEENLKNVEVGKVYEFLIKKPYGERSESLIKIIPISEFYKRNITPVVGMIIDVDGSRGIIRSINSGRVIVDFNHPLAGKDLIFRIEILRQVNDLKERIVGILSYLFRIERNKIDVDIKENEKKVIVKGIEINDKVKEIIKRYVDEIKDFDIVKE